jgi:hypothetical protein
MAAASVSGAAQHSRTEPGDAVQDPAAVLGGGDQAGLAQRGGMLTGSAQGTGDPQAGVAAGW